jgi:hypothetical protein
VSINPELIEAIATELVVDASLVEKEWYAIRIIAAISRVKHWFSLAERVWLRGMG